MTLWSGRFNESMSDDLWRLSESYSFDSVLYDHDLTGSAAHVEGLRDAGLITADECTTLLRALEEIRSEFASGRFERREDDEDIHMAIERRATELVGEVGKKIHTARSRNDQVATTLRLFTRDAIDEVARAALELVDELLGLGDRYPAASLPGYTHLQRAQPVLLSHHLQAHAFALLRDVARLRDARVRVVVSPLGAGALAGSSLPIDPAASARRLGFSSSFANSMDAVSDRDFVAETLFDIALMGVHLSRMGEELVLWTTSEFALATLADAFTTGSSMLPQKKNSDVAELARGKSGRLVGNLTTLLVVLKGLPLSYNRDLQEDKEPLFDSVRQVTLILRALSGAYHSLTFNVDAAHQAADDELLVAIDIAEGLVREGIAFREAHERVGRLVGEAVMSGRRLSELVGADSELSRFAELFDEGAALRNRTSPGAAGPHAASEQRRRLDEELLRLRQEFALA